jgi:hypothetical protein
MSKPKASNPTDRVPKGDRDLLALGHVLVGGFSTREQASIGPPCKYCGKPVPPTVGRTTDYCLNGGLCRDAAAKERKAARGRKRAARPKAQDLCSGVGLRARFVR